MTLKELVLIELAYRVVLRHLVEKTAPDTLFDIRSEVITEIGLNEPDPEARAAMIEAATKILDRD